MCGTELLRAARPGATLGLPSSAVAALTPVGSLVVAACVWQEYDKAQEYYLRAIKADSSNTTAMYNYANMLKHVFKDFDAAQEVCSWSLCRGGGLTSHGHTNTRLLARLHPSLLTLPSPVRCRVPFSSTNV